MKGLLFKAAASGIANGLQGYNQGVEERVKRDQQEKELAIKKGAQDIANRKNQIDIDKIVTDFSREGYQRGPNDQGFVPNLDFGNKSGPDYKVAETNAALKASSSAKSGGAPVLNLGQIDTIRKKQASGEPLTPEEQSWNIGSGYSGMLKPPEAVPQLSPDAVNRIAGATGFDPKDVPGMMSSKNGRAGLSYGATGAGRDASAKRAADALGIAEKRLTQGEQHFTQSQGLEKQKFIAQGTKDLGAKITAQGLPAMSTDFDIIDKYTGLFSKHNPNLSAFASRDESLAGAVPWAGPGLQSTIAEYRGGGKGPVLRATTDYFNTAMKAISGGAVTPSEEVRNRLAKGMAAGASQETIADGLKAAYEVHKQMEGNLLSSEDPEVVSAYRSRPGSYQTIDERIKSRKGQPAPKDAAPAAPVNQSAARAASAKKLGMKKNEMDIISNAPLNGNVNPHPKDSEAVAWAKANKGNPKADKILLLNGVK